MVWAGAGDRHAIHHDLGTLVAQTMQKGNRGQFAVAMQADTGRIGQCIGAVMTGGLPPESRSGNGTGVLPIDLDAGRNYGNLERQVCRNFRAG